MSSVNEKYKLSEPKSKKLEKDTNKTGGSQWIKSDCDSKNIIIYPHYSGPISEASK